jgi:hypothetical protein
MPQERQSRKDLVDKKVLEGRIEFIARTWWKDNGRQSEDLQTQD